MGWDCIWVTPVVKNFYGPDLGESGFGYHGYWAEDFYAIDPSFGTKEDLQELVKETHKYGMLARYFSKGDQELVSDRSDFNTEI